MFNFRPHPKLFVLSFGVALGVAALTSAAQAQSPRTWVSGLGDDAAPCSRTAPCKTFAGAYSRTMPGGEIDALDPSGYGTLTIGYAITIDGGGGQVASMLGSGATTTITVQAGMNDRVVLRNLRINGQNQYMKAPGTTGINFTSGLALAIENCVIEAYSNYGINFQPNTRSNLSVTDSVLVGNGTYGSMTGGALIASTAASSGGFNRVTIAQTRVTDGTSGITAGANTKMQLDNVTVGQTGLGNGDYGLTVNGSAAEMNVDASNISGNQFGGLHATNGGTMRVANSSITYNNTNGILSEAGGQVLSYGNNRVVGNSGMTTFFGPASPGLQ